MKKVFTGLVMWLLMHQPLSAQEAGQFVKRYWYENGIAQGNPNFNHTIRINAPEIGLHPVFGKRVEVRGNGMIQVLAEEALDQIESAALYLEVWGGHPHTQQKKVSVNGRNTYELPEVGTAEGHCTYHYPLIPLKITDLVNGYNVFQFSCEQGASFWGHFLIDNACLLLGLKDGHPELKTTGLQGFEATVSSRPLSADAISLQLAISGRDASAIEKVTYFGYYEAFDDNGNGLERDWHGYTKKKIPQHVLGESRTPPFNVEWDIAMLAPQNNVKVKAEVSFKNNTDISYVTAVTEGITIPVRAESRVDRFRSYDIPVPFWSRAGKLNTCTIVADVVPEKIEKAELHVLIWDGGEGNVKEHFKLNGNALPLAGGKHAHDVIYRIFEIDPSWIKAGENKIELLSDTEHHGIEVLLPGPELRIKSAR